MSGCGLEAILLPTVVQVTSGSRKHPAVSFPCYEKGGHVHPKKGSHLNANLLSLFQSDSNLCMCCYGELARSLQPGEGISPAVFIYPEGRKEIILFSALLKEGGRIAKPHPHTWGWP